MKSILIYLFLVSVCRFDSTETLFVSDHEDLLLVPSLVFPGTGKANDSNDDHWNLQIHSWLFKVNSFRSMLATSILSTMIDDMDSNRISYLTASGRSNKLVCFRSTDTRVCAPTDKKGRLQLQIRFNSEQLNSIRVGRDLDEKFVYSMSTEDKRIQSTGELFLCRNDGISIISDIVRQIRIDWLILRLCLVLRHPGRYNQAHRCQQPATRSSKHLLQSLPIGPGNVWTVSTLSNALQCLVSLFDRVARPTLSIFTRIHRSRIFPVRFIPHETFHLDGFEFLQFLSLVVFRWTEEIHSEHVLPSNDATEIHFLRWYFPERPRDLQRYL